MNIVVITTIIACLFLVIGLAEPLAARMRLPYVVMLALLGILIGAGSTFFLHTELTDALNPVAEAILGLPIRANVFLYVFLPTLLFQATLGMDLRRMLDDWVPILALAVVAVLVAALAIGYALFWTGVLPLTACLLIGAIVSTTDPSGVIGIFRSISAPQRLSRIIEGESLLNDAAAIALFGIFMGFVMQGVPNPSLQGALASFPLLIAGGAMIGWLIARLTIPVMALIGRYELAQLSVSVARPCLAYIGAELHMALIREIRERRVARRPRLKLPTRKTELLRHFPRFANLDNAILDKLSSAAITRYVNAGTVIVQKNTAIKNVYCVVSGTIEMRSDNRKTHRLVRGDMFGPISRSPRNQHRTEAIAATASTLLVLSERRIGNLLEMNLV